MSRNAFSQLEREYIETIAWHEQAAAERAKWSERYPAEKTPTECKHESGERFHKWDADGCGYYMWRCDVCGHEEVDTMP